MTRRIAFTLLSATLALPALAQDKVRSLTGNYIAEGRNPDGSAYSGTVRIEETDGAVAFAWNVGGQTYAGTGVREGRVVTVDWGAETPVVYVVMPGRELHGTWGGGTALERLVRE
ncbi:MAG: hypothetical protein GKR99_02065 [Rhodobacteraceae bacterium]|nr:hypothetical protein [Paracoccaceae bacterium]